MQECFGKKIISSPCILMAVSLMVCMSTQKQLLTISLWNSSQRLSLLYTTDLLDSWKYPELFVYFWGFHLFR